MLYSKSLLLIYFIYTWMIAAVTFQLMETGVENEGKKVLINSKLFLVPVMQLT